MQLQDWLFLEDRLAPHVGERVLCDYTESATLHICACVETESSHTISELVRGETRPTLQLTRR
jgi:hypothetical protein